MRNPSGTPVLVAVRARRAWPPARLAGPSSVAVPRRTGGLRFRPDRYPAVGVVAPGGVAALTVPAPAPGRRYLVTVVVGQEGGRLRVYRLRAGGGAGTARQRDESAAPCLLP